MHLSTHGAVLLVGATSAFAQLSVGATVGGTVTRDFVGGEAAGYKYGSERLLVGPTVRFRSASGFGLEAGALSKRIAFGYRFGRNAAYEDYTAEARVWQVPILAGFGRRTGPTAPYVHGGPVLRWISGGTKTGQNCRVIPTLSCSPFSSERLTNIADRSGTGLTLGAGMEIPIGYFQVSPELRFTRWTGQPFIQLTSNENEVAILLRIAFAPRTSATPASSARRSRVRR